MYYRESVNRLWTVYFRLFSQQKVVPVKTVNCTNQDRVEKDNDVHFKTCMEKKHPKHTESGQIVWNW